MPMCSTGIHDMFPQKDWNIGMEYFEKTRKKNSIRCNMEIFLDTFSDICFKKYGVRPRAKQAITNYGGVNLE